MIIINLIVIIDRSIARSLLLNDHSNSYIYTLLCISCVYTTSNAFDYNQDCFYKNKTLKHKFTIVIKSIFSGWNSIF